VLLISPTVVALRSGPNSSARTDGGVVGVAVT